MSDCVLPPSLMVRPLTDDTHPSAVAGELEAEQAHVDRVYAELEKASQRAALVEAEGLARTRTDRSGDVREEELAGLFERDALVYTANRRQHALQQQYEGLVFGRLDLDHGGSNGRSLAGGADLDREVRYVGRLGVRDDDYEPLVIDWRARAAEPFYRATPVEPMGVVRRRVLRCRGPVVVGAEDDLMVAEPPDGMVVLGDGALMAALTRSRGARMRDIVATIQADQDEAIRAPARGVTEITGGPGTGKTVVALHRAAYLLYSDRRRFEAGGVLVVGPSAAYTAYIERVLPSLGEDAVTLRSVGDLVDAVSTARLDSPEVAALKGSLRIRRMLGRAAREPIPGSSDELRLFVAGHAVRLTRADLDRCRAQVLRHHPRNASADAMAESLARCAWEKTKSGDRAEFLEAFADHLDVDAFLKSWWRPVDPREVLLWLADSGLARRCGSGVFSTEESEAIADSIRRAIEVGTWSVADVALIDDLVGRMGPVPEIQEERGFYEIEEYDDTAAFGVSELGAVNARTGRRVGAVASRRANDPFVALLQGRLERPGEYAHVLVDEAQDLSPMQWRMVGRRGRWASWTVVGDAAQASWSDPEEATAARVEAFGTDRRQSFHMRTNYRNAREIFGYAAQVILPVMPDADIPEAVRETGVDPVDVTVPPGELGAAVAGALDALADEVNGSIAIIAPPSRLGDMSHLSGTKDDRVVVTDPLSAKGLEYDATVVVDPDGIIAESPGGARVLYVALTRAAHRMHVLRVQQGEPSQPTIDAATGLPVISLGRSVIADDVAEALDEE